MWENRSETLKEYMYDLIFKTARKCQVTCKIWETGTGENPPNEYDIYE
jgi:hypothetical protein